MAAGPPIKVVPVSMAAYDADPEGKGIDAFPTVKSRQDGKQGFFV